MAAMVFRTCSPLIAIPLLVEWPWDQEKVDTEPKFSARQLDGRCLGHDAGCLTSELVRIGSPQAQVPRTLS